MSQVQKETQIVKKENETVKQITIGYIDYRMLIYKKLKKEFQKDLKKWNAEIIKDALIVRFLSPDIMFSPGSSTIKPEFKSILNSFCPRYFKILHKSENIEEIRIEGHTSTEWEGTADMNAYFKNMKLSQDRTRVVLRYCVKNTNIRRELRRWAISKLTANGLSSSRPICNQDTVRCRRFNRRVEFRIQINAHDVIKKVTDPSLLMTSKSQKSEKRKEQ